MKFLIVLACALAAASAGYIAAPVVYGAQHLPVIGPNGVPIDTAEVQHARAAHYAHKVEAHARNGDFAYGYAAPLAYAHAAPVVASTYAHAAPVVAAGYAQHGLVAAYPTTHVLPSSINGVPLETPEVVAAKSHHFAAHAEALARNAHSIHYRKRRGIYAAPLAYSTPLLAHAPVVAATYAHAAPLATSYAYNHATHYGAYAHPYGYAGYY